MPREQNIDYDNLCEQSGRRIMDADHIAQDICGILNKAESKKAALALAKKLRMEAVKKESFLRAFIIDSAARELTLELEGELP